MNFDELSQQVEKLRSQMANVLQCGDLKPSSAQQLFCELDTALAELQVAGQKLHQQHEELLVTHQRYHYLLEEAPYGYLVTDGKGTISEVNRTAAKILHVSPQFLVGQPLALFVAESERQVFCSKLSRLSQIEGIKDWEVCLMPPNGELLIAALSVTVLRFEAGQQMSLQWWLRDITQGEKIKTALERLRFQNELILNSAGEGIYGLDSQGNTTFVNPAAASMVGWNSAELLGKPMHEILHHSKADGTPYPWSDCSICASFKDGLSRQVDNEVFWRKDGSSFPVEYTSTPIREAGKVVGTVVIFKDITERKLAEVELHQLNTNLECLVQERTAQLQRALDFEAMLKRISDKVRDNLDESQILQTAVKELALGLGLGGCNASWYNLVDGTSKVCSEYVTFIPESGCRARQMADFPEIYQQLLQGQYFQFCSIVPHPHRGRVAMLACPIVGEEGIVGDLWLINSMEYAFDELELRLVQQVANQCAIALRTAQLYQAATAQVKELEKLNQLKDDFLSTVSHELRTPIANMKVAIRLLQTAPKLERQERYLQLLQIECDREAELINNLLDLQQLEAQSYSILLETLDLKEWIFNIVGAFQLRMQQHQQILRVDLPQQIEPILCDRPSLERILVELLNNAHKYTASGGEILLNVQQKPAVEVVSCNQAGAGNSLATVLKNEMVTTLTISNEAEIPTAQLPQIFEKFYRVPQRDRWRQGGTGLGLALVKRLVEHLQGSIQVESSGGWTTFTVELPNQPRV